MQANSLAICRPPSALCRAAQFGLKEVVQKLLEYDVLLKKLIGHDIGPVIPNEIPQNPLYFAARHGQVEVLELLLNHVKNFGEDGQKNTTTYLGECLLHATSNGHVDVVNLLLAFEAGKYISSKVRNEALDYSCHVGHFEIVRIMAKAGCDLNEGHSLRKDGSYLGVAV